MAHEIKMPQLSDTMDSGKILVWHKKEGDTVERGDILAEVETDKANLEIESFHQGVLLKIVTNADAEAAVGQVIAYIGAAGEALPGGSNSSGNSEATGSSEKVGEPSTSSEPSTSPTMEVATPEVVLADEGGRVKASPLARKIASQHCINLGTLHGSGPGGRIVKKDVQSAIVGGGATATTPMGTTSPYTPASHLPAISGAVPAVTGLATQSEVSGDGTYTPLSKMRATIAKRMQQTVTQSPHFYVRTSVRMDHLLQLRQQLKETPGYEQVSINHLIIKACGYALSKEPGVNNAMKNEMLFTPHGIHIGVVTAVEGGLMIPVIKNVPQLDLKDLAFEARAGIERARAGRPNSDDLSGGTFSISNMGMFDVEDFTALINPGQGAILAVSSTKETPIVSQGRIEVAQMMNVTLSVDHRIIDGVMAGNFLKAFKAAVENPTLLVIH